MNGVSVGHTIVIGEEIKTEIKDSSSDSKQTRIICNVNEQTKTVRYHRGKCILTIAMGDALILSHLLGFE